MIPETRYAETIDGVHIAYQVRSEGSVDLVYIAGFAGNYEIDLLEPRMARFLDGLSSISRLIVFDKRGTGLSDRHQTPDLEMRADDLRAVLDAVGSERAVLFGESEGGALAAFFAATHPDRVLALVTYGSVARRAWAPDYPSGWTKDLYLADHEAIASGWGTIEFAKTWVDDEAPSLSNDTDFVHSFARSLRHAASPAAALAFHEVLYGLDVREVLGSVQAPTLVLCRPGVFPDEGPIGSRYLADKIPGARYVELSGRDHLIAAGNTDELLVALKSFLEAIHSEEIEFERILATVLFTDIVGSTSKATEVGDRRWKELVEQHHTTVRALVGRYRGHEVDTAGDGFFATFDGPARAIRCAMSIVEAVRELGLEVRAGVHTGEVETIADKVGGIAVVIGSRVAGIAGSSEVLVSQTVKDLVAGSALTFEDRGSHSLKGVPDEWRLWAAAPR